MAEQTLWSGTSSQVKNLGAFLLCAVLVAVGIAAFLGVGFFAGQEVLGVVFLALGALAFLWAMWKWLQVRTHTYQLTDERLLITCGIFSRTSDTLELYRVRDMQVHQPLKQRIFGLHNINLITSDSSTPEIVLDHMPAAAGLPDLLRKHIELCRERKKVREIDIE